MSRRLSRGRLAILFVVALVAGIALRLLLMPPTIALTGVESNLVGNWDVVNQANQTSLLWQFDRERQVSISEQVDGDTYSEIWSGRWQLRDQQMRITKIKVANAGDARDTAEFTVKFADTPEELFWKDSNGVQFRATKSR